jgi:hypothetical protein
MVMTRLEMSTIRRFALFSSTGSRSAAEVIFCILAVILLSAIAPVEAQETVVFPITDRALNLSTGGPGARALGFGGAFIAIADDASAVEWNPAGMGHQHRLQTLCEILNQKIPVPGFSGGEFATQHSFYENSINLAVVHPFDWGNVGFGVFRPVQWDHAWTWQDSSVHGGKGAPAEDEGSFAFSNMKNVSHLSIYNIDLAYSYDFKSRLSLGITGRLHQMNKSYSFSVRSSPTDYLWIKEVETRRYDFSLILGALYRPMKDLALGFVLKTPARFRYNEFSGDGSRKSDYVNLPLVAGIGSAVDLWKYLKVTVDLDYLAYDTMGRDSSMVGNPSSPEDLTLTAHRDAWEYHGGLQYIVPLSIGDKLIMLGGRAGISNRQPYQLFYSRGFTDAPPYEELFARDREEHHYSIGLSGRYLQYQIDLGYDRDEFSYRAFSFTIKTFVSVDEIARLFS